jgi:hypothetical protein
MTTLFGRPKMVKTRTQGLTVGFRQGLYSPVGIGTLFIQVLDDREIELNPVPRKYYQELRNAPDAVMIMNQLLRMYL